MGKLSFSNFLASLSSFPFWLLYSILMAGYIFDIPDKEIRRHGSFRILKMTIITGFLCIISMLHNAHASKESKLADPVGQTFI